jgi:hypothetical protein
MLTRCKRCRAHVDKWWLGNDAFEREVARMLLEVHRVDVGIAEHCVNPEIYTRNSRGTDVNKMFVFVIVFHTSANNVVCSFTQQRFTYDFIALRK